MAWRLTRRGWVVLGLLIAAVFLVATWWAFTTGQVSQCQWYRQHAPQQAQSYCNR